jgi:hypothetical protein
MRKLYLVNEIGTTYFFSFKNGTLIEGLDGFGFEYDIEYQEYDARFVESKRTSPQRTISLDLVFLNGYQGFTAWREFVTKSKVLRLFYVCDGTKYCYINIKSSSKTQLEAGVLKSSVEIECLSLWLVDRYSSIHVNQSDEGKTYPYSYSYLYAVSFNGKVTVVNNSAKSVPLKVKITGNVLNPRVIVRQNEVDIASMRLILDERESPVIEVNAYPVDQYIIKTLNGEIIDIYNSQDFSYDNFLFLPPGTSEIFFDPGVREESTCQIEYSEEYVAH